MAIHLENVIRKAINSLKATVVDEVVMATHSDYAELAKLPGLILYYPELVPFRPNEANEQRIEKNTDNTTTIRPPKIFRSLAFSLEILADRIHGSGSLVEIQAGFLVWLQQNGSIEVDGIEYDLAGELESMSTQWTNNNSNLRKITGTFTIEGVEIDSGEQSTGYVVLERTFDSADAADPNKTADSVSVPS